MGKPRAYTEAELVILGDYASQHQSAYAALRAIRQARLLEDRTDSALISALGKVCRQQAAARRAVDARALLRALLARYKLLLDGERLKYGAWARLRRRHRDWPANAETALCAIWRQGWAPQCWERRLELAVRGLP